MTDTTTITIREGALTAASAKQIDYILLDGSGSMSTKWWPMLGAIDAYIAGLKAAQVDTHITLQVFDSTDREYIARSIDIAAWRNFNDEPIGMHGGMTPLYDAICLMGRNIRELNPPPSRILIVTDGGDSGAGTNMFGTLPQAHAVLEYLRSLGHQVTFYGCEFNNETQARALGATAANTIGVMTSQLENAAATLARKAAAHSKSGVDINFSSDERSQFGGYLTGAK